MARQKPKKRKPDSDLDSLRYVFSWQHITYDKLPFHMKDNDFIRTGYRPPMKSHLLAFSSVFRLHNETTNIWLHIIGTMIYFWIFLQLTIYKPSDYTFLDYLMISSYSVINMMTFSFSSLFHILNCMNQETYLFWCKLDYFGITLLIASSIITWVYYAFYTYDISMIFYMTSTAVLAFLIACLILTKNLNSPEKRLLRSVTFGIFGLLGVIPTFHYHFFLTEVCFTVPAMFMIAFFYIIGILIYFFRIPERWSTKNRFDLIGSSHNFFHFFVIAGSLTHYYALATLASERISAFRNHCKA